MKKLSFFKGLLIGSLFSAVCWVGIYEVVNTNSMEEKPAEQIVQPQKPIGPIASL